MAHDETDFNKQFLKQLSGLNGAINKLAENVSPPDTSVVETLRKLKFDIKLDAKLDVPEIVEAIDRHSENTGKWLGAITTEISNGLAAVVAELAKLQPPTPPPAQHKGVIKFMFVLKDDNPDVTFSLVTGDVTDAEGNPIPDAALDLAVASTDEAVVAVAFDAAAKTGSIHIGSPGVATVTATASSGGVLLGSGAADFTVTVGDPAAITEVKLAFDGISEA